MDASGEAVEIPKSDNFKVFACELRPTAPSLGQQIRTPQFDIRIPISGNEQIQEYSIGELVLGCRRAGSAVFSPRTLDRILKFKVCLVFCASCPLQLAYAPPSPLCIAAMRDSRIGSRNTGDLRRSNFCCVLLARMFVREEERTFCL